MASTRCRNESARRPAVAARADPQLTQAALENLLGNAWKFTRKTPEVRIEFGKTKHRGKSAYFIRDNGASFAYAGKLFAPFQRQAVTLMHDGAADLILKSNLSRLVPASPCRVRRSVWQSLPQWAVILAC